MRRVFFAGRRPASIPAILPPANLPGTARTRLPSASLRRRDGPGNRAGSLTTAERANRLSSMRKRTAEKSMASLVKGFTIPRAVRDEQVDFPGVFGFPDRLWTSGIPGAQECRGILYLVHDNPRPLPPFRRLSVLTHRGRRVRDILPSGVSDGPAITEHPHTRRGRSILKTGGSSSSAISRFLRFRTPDSRRWFPPVPLAVEGRGDLLCRGRRDS